MFYKVFLLSFIFAFCDSQEHLTCLRTNDVLSTPPVRNQQGSPGKQGPIGSKGSIGQKGSKGDPGVPDNSLVNSLRNEVATLRQQVQNLTQLTSAYYRGYRLLDDGWIALFNGYQYKMTPSGQSWSNTRTICQNFGGDLAVHGVQSMESIRTLLNAFSLSSDCWIGLNDRESEGTWVWVNGERELQSATFWWSGEPNNFGNGEDCAQLSFYPTRLPSFFDGNCSNSRRGICEKSVA